MSKKWEENFSQIRILKRKKIILEMLYEDKNMEKAINNLIIELLPIYLPIIILGILGAIFYKKIVGKAGEFYVKNELKKLPKEKYLILNDILIENNNITCQIDHVVVSEFGIFVIETKQYNGYIVGNEYDKNWKQNNKFYINNPIHQNYGHIKALQNVLKLDYDKFIPIVCISSTARLKIKSKSHVLHIYELNKIILSYKKKIIDNYNEIYKTIVNLNIVDKKRRTQHISYEKEIKNNKEINQENTCPKCGGKLIKRNGKYGDFIGCSNYPKCKYTKKVM